jgi:predicted ribosomally synthesized peptide with SipW-like signal peptide
MKFDDEKKLTEKAFSRAIFTSIFGIIICLVCLCSATWAWFTESEEFTGGTLKAGECLLSITVTDENSHSLSNVDDGVMLDANKNYTVTLSLPRSSTSGYCMIKTTNDVFYTDFIFYHDNDTAETISFTIKVESAQTVKFIKRWGIYSGDVDVSNGGTLIIPASIVA